MKILVLMCSCFLLASCGSKTVVTTTNLDGTKTTTESPSSFWKSDNLAMHYEFETARVTKTAEVAEKKLVALAEEGLRRAASLTTDTERAMSSLITQMMMDRVQTTPPPSGQQAPKTAVDFFDKNGVALLNTGLMAYRIFSSDSGDSYSESTNSPTITNTGSGNVFFQSDGNMSPEYTLSSSGESSLGLDVTNENAFHPAYNINDESTSNTSESYGLTF